MQIVESKRAPPRLRLRRKTQSDNAQKSQCPAGSDMRDGARVPQCVLRALKIQGLVVELTASMASPSLELAWQKNRYSGQSVAHPLYQTKQTWRQLRDPNHKLLVIFFELFQQLWRTTSLQVLVKHGMNKVYVSFE